MGLRAADEDTPAGFKQFRSRDNDGATLDPKAVVTYNAWPTVASRATVPATACVTGGSRPLVNTLTPQLKATVSDGDNTAMSVEFEWWPVGGAARSGGQTVTGVASGGTATVTVPAGAFADGGRYQWRVRASDGVDDSAVWSPFCELTTYVTVPPVAGCESGAANDFNGDGVVDTAIGVPKATVDGFDRAGSVQVVNGATGAASTLREGAGGVPDTVAAGEQFGQTLAVFDANNDGCADLAVGAPYEDSGTMADSGRVFLIYGAPDGLGTGPAALLIEQGRALEQGRGAVPDAPEAGDWFGFALAARRTAAGEPFLVVGAPGEDIGTAVDAGKVRYLRNTTNIAFDESQVNADGRLENDDRFGYALAATGYQFAIAQPGEAIGTAVFSGAVCLYTHTITGSLPGLIKCVFQGAAGVSEPGEPGDQFGRSIAMVPYRPVGAAASVANSLLVVGVPGEDLAGVSDAGMVQQFLVTPTAVTELAALSQASAGVAYDEHRVEFVIGLNPAFDEVGKSLAALATFPLLSGPIGKGETVTLPDPILPGGKMYTYLMIPRVGDFVPKLALDDGSHVETLPVVPMYESELALKKEYGAAWFMRRLTEQGLSISDPFRRPIQ